MYKSTDAGGRPVAVTGAYIEPSAAWKGGGPRPLVARGLGHHGPGRPVRPLAGAAAPADHQRATRCPSATTTWRSTASSPTAPPSSSPTTSASARPTGCTPTSTGVDEGHAVLDAARAARSVTGASVTADSRVGLYGYSQGGGASASAAELQSSYAPDVNLAGTYAGAPPADLTEVMKGIDGSALAGALGWSINGFAQSDPSLGAVVEANIERRRARPR